MTTRGLPTSSEGLVVRDIERGSPAVRTGLRPGDVILEVDREPVGSVEELANASSPADQRSLLLVYRAGNTLFMSIPKID